MIEHSVIKVKKFKKRPMQCFKCFEYGHVISKCPNPARCRICSEEHELDYDCNKPRYCLHCKGPHSPNSKSCEVYKLEENILDVSYDEKVSYGTARKILGANKRSFAAASKQNKPNQNLSSSRSNLSESSNQASSSTSNTNVSKNSGNKSSEETQVEQVLAAASNDGFWAKSPSKQNYSPNRKTQAASEVQLQNRFEALSSLDEPEELNSQNGQDVLSINKLEESGAGKTSNPVTEEDEVMDTENVQSQSVRRKRGRDLENSPPLQKKKPNNNSQSPKRNQSTKKQAEETVSQTLNKPVKKSNDKTSIDTFSVTLPGTGLLESED